MCMYGYYLGIGVYLCQPIPCLSVCASGCSNSRAVTLVVYGGNQMVVAEAERCVHDALCVVRTLVRDGRVVAGGGAAEIAAARAVEAAADAVPSVSQYAARAFGDALLGMAEALAANSGLSAIQEVQKVKAMQQQEDYPYYGIDCMQTVSEAFGFSLSLWLCFSVFCLGLRV